MLYNNSNTLAGPGEIAVFEEFAYYNDFWSSVNEKNNDDFLINNYVRFYFYKNYLFLSEYNNTIGNVYSRFLKYGDHFISARLRNIPYTWGHLYNDDTGVSLHANYLHALQQKIVLKQDINIVEYHISEKAYINFFQDMLRYNDIAPEYLQLLYQVVTPDINVKGKIYLLSIGHGQIINKKNSIINGVIMPIIIAEDTILSVPAVAIIAASMLKDLSSFNGYYSKYQEYILKKQIHHPYMNIIKSIFSNPLLHRLPLSILLTEIYSKITQELIQNKNIACYIKIRKRKYSLVNFLMLDNSGLNILKVFINYAFLVNFHNDFKLYSCWVMNDIKSIIPAARYVCNGNCINGERINWKRVRLVSSDNPFVKIDINKSVLANYSLSNIWYSHKGYMTIRNICKSFLMKMNILKEQADYLHRSYFSQFNHDNSKRILINIVTYFNLIGWTQFSDAYRKKA